MVFHPVREGSQATGMQDPNADQGVPHAAATGFDSQGRTSPSNSRMLANYLAHIEQLLDKQRYDAALREAFDLPYVAAALAEPQLGGSGERVKAWCDKWLRPLEAERDCPEFDNLRVYRILSERLEREELASSEPVPVKALRRLRLGRLTRSALGGISAERDTALDPEEADAVETCSILIEAARRWYAHSACHDGTVQANLARLAVLR